MFVQAKMKSSNQRADHGGSIGQLIFNNDRVNFSRVFLPIKHLLDFFVLDFFFSQKNKVTRIYMRRRWTY